MVHNIKKAIAWTVWTLNQPVRCLVTLTFVLTLAYAYLHTIPKTYINMLMTTSTLLFIAEVALATPLILGKWIYILTLKRKLQLYLPMIPGFTYLISFIVTYHIDEVAETSSLVLIPLIVLFVFGLVVEVDDDIDFIRKYKIYRVVAREGSGIHKSVEG